MRTSVVSLVALSSHFASALADPLIARDSVCGGFTGFAKCCSLDVEHLADADCVASPEIPTSIEHFKMVCPKDKGPKCCTLPIVDLSLVCKDP